MFSSIEKLHADRQVIAQYLQNGTELAVSGAMVSDIISAEAHYIGPLVTQTDGCWIWPSDLGYYVVNYGVALPDEFVQRVQALRGVPPKLTGKELMEVEKAIFGD
ncbi:hypothetical protein [Nonomuraea sp. B19D2]|uniref:hypothetical protein n=1 Tax=Nonomuraea sp. B19D2 TaxID=3159561 RepID=UPI0032DA2D77